MAALVTYGLSGTVTVQDFIDLGERLAADGVNRDLQFDAEENDGLFLSVTTELADV